MMNTYYPPALLQNTNLLLLKQRQTELQIASFDIVSGFIYDTCRAKDYLEKMSLISKCDEDQEAYAYYSELLEQLDLLGQPQLMIDAMNELEAINKEILILEAD